MANKLSYTNKGWSEKSFQYHGDLYYTFITAALVLYSFGKNINLLIPSYGMTFVLGIITFFYMKKVKMYIYSPGLISRFFLFLIITPVAYLADIKILFSGFILFFSFWMLAEKTRHRFIPQGFALSLSVTIIGLIWHPEYAASLTEPIFISLREKEVAGLTFAPFFYRHEGISLGMSFSFLEGAGFYSLMILPVMLVRRIEFFISFLLMLIGFGIAYEFNQLEMAITWSAIYFQPGKKIFDHPWVSLIVSFIVMAIMMSVQFVILPPLFFIILYFLIEGTGLMILSKYKRVLL